MPGGWRVWVEVTGFVVTVIACLIAFYQVLGPTLRDDERAALASEIATALQDQGVDVAGLDPSKSGADIAQEIATAVAQVRDVKNAFELKAGESKEVTEHGVLVTNLGVKDSGGRINELQGGVAGEVFKMTLGRSYPLPAPADNGTVAVVGINDWWAIHRGEAPDKAVFRVRCG